MTAGDWVGWLIISVAAIAGLAIGASQLAVYWPDLKRWVRLRVYAAKHAPVLIAKACASDQVLLDLARVRAERDELRRENGRLSREIRRLQDRERSSVTVLQLPRI